MTQAGCWGGGGGGGGGLQEGLKRTTPLAQGPAQGRGESAGEAPTLQRVWAGARVPVPTFPQGCALGVSDAAVTPAESVGTSQGSDRRHGHRETATNLKHLQSHGRNPANRRRSRAHGPAPTPAVLTCPRFSDPPPPHVHVSEHPSDIVLLHPDRQRASKGMGTFLQGLSVIIIPNNTKAGSLVSSDGLSRGRFFQSSKRCLFKVIC